LKIETADKRYRRAAARATRNLLRFFDIAPDQLQSHTPGSGGAWAWEAASTLTQVNANPSDMAMVQLWWRGFRQGKNGGLFRPNRRHFYPTWSWL